MSDPPRRRSGSLLSAREDERLAELLRLVEDRVPLGYRQELFAYLLPRAVGADEGGPSPVATHTAAGLARTAASAESSAADRLAEYRPLLERRGHLLIKALAGLVVAADVLDVVWMTPGELVKLLGRGGPSARLHRSNVSSALRNAGDVVARRRRGRGFEYAITTTGRARLARELRVTGGSAAPD